MCSKLWARKLRRQSWNKDIRGVEVGHPLEALESVEIGAYCTRKDEGRHIRVFISPPKSHGDFYSAPGPFTPYIGSETKEKTVKTVGSTAFVVEPLIKPVTRMMRALGWFIPRDSPAADLVRRIGRSVTDLDLTSFEASDDVNAGSATHRYSGTSMDKTARLNVLHAIPTWLSINTETLTVLSRGSRNTDAHFQTLMLYSQNMVIDRISQEWSATDPLDYHFHLKCPSCIEEIDDSPLEGDEDWNLVEFPSFPDNPYLFVSAERAAAKELQQDRSGVDGTQISRTHLTMEQKEDTALYHLGLRIIKSDEDHEVKEHDMIPWTWLPRLNFTRFTECLIFAAAAAEWSRWAREATEQKLSITRLISGVQRRLVRIHPDVLGLLANAFIDPVSRQSLLSSEYSFLSPAETVPNKTLAGIALKEGLVNSVQVVLLKKTLPNLVYLRGFASRTDIGSYEMFKTYWRSPILIEEALKFREWWNDKEAPMSAIDINPRICLTSPDSLFKELPRLDLSVLPKDPPSSKLPRISSIVEVTRSTSGVVPKSLFKLALREPKLITGAIYRVLDILTWCAIHRIDLGTTAYVVGDGTGGISATLASRGMKIYYQTLVDYHRVTQQGLSVQYPNSFDYLKYNLKGSLMNRGDFASYYSDLTSPTFRIHIPHYKCQELGVVWGDAEGTFWSKPGAVAEYAANLVALAEAYGSAKCVIIMKVYMSPDIWDELTPLTQHGGIRVLHSAWSTQGNTECYLCVTPGSPVSAVPRVTPGNLSTRFPDPEVVSSYQQIVQSLLSPKVLNNMCGNASYVRRGLESTSDKLEMMDRLRLTAELLMRSYEAEVMPRTFGIWARGADSSLQINFLHEVFGLLMCIAAANSDFGGFEEEQDFFQGLMGNATASLEKEGAKLHLSFLVGAPYSTDLTKWVTIRLFQGGNAQFMKRTYELWGRIRMLKKRKKSHPSVIKMINCQRVKSMKNRRYVLTEDEIIFPSSRATFKRTAKGAVYPSNRFGDWLEVMVMGELCEEVQEFDD